MSDAQIVQAMTITGRALIVIGAAWFLWWALCQLGNRNTDDTRDAHTETEPRAFICTPGAAELLDQTVTAYCPHHPWIQRRMTFREAMTTRCPACQAEDDQQEASGRDDEMTPEVVDLERRLTDTRDDVR